MGKGLGGFVMAAVFVGGILAIGHFFGSSGTSDEEASIYDRIGGTEGITQVIDNFVGYAAADDMINGRFTDVDIDNFKRLMVEQVCEATGGPCTYSGRSMLEAHRGMGVTEMEFEIVAKHFSQAMKDAGVGQEEHDAIMGVAGSMHDDIVGH